MARTHPTAGLCVEQGTIGQGLEPRNSLPNMATCDTFTTDRLPVVLLSGSALEKIIYAYFTSQPSNGKWTADFKLTGSPRVVLRVALVPQYRNKLPGF